MWSSRSSGVRRPVISSSACRAADELSEHQLFGRAIRERCLRPFDRRPARHRRARDAARSRSPADRAARRDRSARRRCAAADRRALRRSAPTLRRPIADPRARRSPTPRGRSILLTTTTRGPAPVAISSSRLTGNGADPSSTTTVSAATCCACSRAADAFGLDRVGRLAQPGGVDERHRQPPMSTRSVSRSRVVPGTSVTIARVGADQRVEQARLAGVRRAGDHDQAALAHDTPGASVAWRARSRLAATAASDLQRPRRA